MIRLEDARDEDVQLIEQWYKDDDQAHRMELGTPTEWLASHHHLHHWGWIAYDGQAAVGFIDLEKDSHKYDAANFKVYVAPNFRGRGYSKFMVTSAIEQAMKKNFRLLHGWVNLDNHKIVDTLTKAGFSNVGKDRSNMMQFSKELV